MGYFGDIVQGRELHYVLFIYSLFLTIFVVIEG